MNAIRSVDAPRASATNATATPHWTDVKVDILSDASQHSERLNFNANAKDKLTQALNSIVRGNPMHGAFLANFAAAAVAALPTLKLDGLDKNAAIAQVLRLAPRSSENPTKAKEGIASAVLDFLALKSAADVVEKKASARGLSGAEVMLAIGKGDTSLAELAAAATLAAQMIYAQPTKRQLQSVDEALAPTLKLAQSAANTVLIRNQEQLDRDVWVAARNGGVQLKREMSDDSWKKVCTSAARQLGLLAA